MADRFRSFLDSRPLCTNYNLHLFLPPKRLSSALVHSHYSRINRIKRRPLHLTQLSKPSSPIPPSSDFDVISTHEHSDGSLIFRFGDPSEIAKTKQMEESKVEKKEIEREGKEEDCTVKVLDGDHEREVIPTKTEREVKGSDSTELTNESSSIATRSKTISILDTENESSEKLLEHSNEIELPIVVSNVDMKISSTPDNDIENIENAEEGLDKKHEDSCPAIAMAFDENLNRENSIVTAKSPVKNIVDVTPSQSISVKPDSVIDDSSDFDVISAHEHSDGSLIFRFWDPSEIAKKIQMEETRVEKKDIEREGKEDGSTVKVLDGDHKREVILTKTEIEVKGSDSTELTDKSSSIATRSKTISIVETENESSEKLLECSNEIELPIVVSNVDVKISSTPDNDIEDTENAEECLNKKHEDSCPARASSFDENLNRENSTVTAKSPAKSTVDVASSQLIFEKPDSVIDDSENVEIAEEGLNKENGDSAGASAFDKNLKAESSIATVESPEKKIVDVTSLQSISVNPDTVIAVSENVIFQESLETDNMTEVLTNETIEDGVENGSNELLSLSPQLEPTLSLSEDAEDQNLQAEMQNVAFESCSRSDSNDIVAISPQMEAAMYLTMDAESQTSLDGTGMTNEIAIDENESATIQLMPMSSQLESEPVIYEESGNGKVEDYMGGDGAESCMMLDNMPQNLIPEPERNDEGDNLENNGTVEASGNEVKELECTEAATNSQEILMTNFVLSTGAALLPHPSKVLTGGEDAYFISGKKWLGVADGVGLWSLEGINPGVYAQELMKNCEKLISDCNGNSINHPKELLNLSVAETHSPGSSTVLIAQCDGQALQVVNAGDSGFIILRHGTIYKMSSPMLHAFHFPLRIERGHDPLNQVEFYQIDLKEEDVIVIATDGLLDNLYDQEIASIILKSLAANKTLEEITQNLATKAQDMGRSASARSPFSDNAQAAGYAGYTGGKLDDVTVIVSTVQKQSNSQTS